MSPSLGPDPEGRVLDLVDQRVREMMRGTLMSTDVKPRSVRPDRIDPGGSPSYVLKNVGGTAMWVPSFAFGRMYLSAGVNFNANTESLMTAWTQEQETDAAVVDVAAGSAVIYARRTGWYQINYQAMFALTGTVLNGYIAIKNSTGTYIGVVPFQNVGGFYNPGNAQSTIVALGAGDWVAMYVYANWTGGGIYSTVGGNRWNTFIEMAYLGDY